MRRTKYHWLTLAALTCTVLFATACNTTPRAEQMPTEQRMTERNHGYALLYDLVSRQRQLPGILIIKQESRQTQQLVVEIGDFCKSVYQQLNDMVKEEATLGYDQKGLPAIEEAARAAIAATHRKGLLGATDEFELRLMLTQTDGLAYGAHLCKVIAERETVDARREKLEQWQQRFNGLREKVVRHIIDLQMQE